MTPGQMDTRSATALLPSTGTSSGDQLASEHDWSISTIITYVAAAASVHGVTACCKRASSNLHISQTSVLELCASVVKRIIRSPIK